MTASFLSRLTALDHGHNGQLLAKVKPLASAQCDAGRYAAIGTDNAPGPWPSAGLFNNSRSMPVNGLTPGTMYTFQFRAIGRSTVHSDWSDPSSQLSL